MMELSQLLSVRVFVAGSAFLPRGVKERHDYKSF